MKLEVLISAMYQTDMSIAKKSNTDTDVLIINQCDCNGYDEEIYNGYKIRMISTTERGVSRSRNMAIRNSTGDICIICDDDEVFRDGYKEAVLKAFEEELKADIIAFNVNHVNARHKRKMNTEFKKASWWRTYGAWCLVFRKDKILEKEVFFNEKWGPGSGKITHAEESVWQFEARRKGLKLYQHPFCIADVEQAESTWFEGYNEKYYYENGAYLYVVFPKLKHIFKYYYIYRLHSVSKLSIKEQIKWLNNGMKGYKEELSYEEYIDRYEK